MKISRKLLAFMVINLCTLSQGELYTAISDVEPLLETQKRIIEDLDDYITKEDDRLDLSIVNGYLKMCKREHDKAMDDITNYLGNPINVFTLIKRMTTDLTFIKQTIDNGPHKIKKVAITDYPDTIYPTLEDLTGAAQALTRLQETYHLDVADLAEGILNGVAYSSKMSAGDCYELGRILYNVKDFTNALAWMTAALRKFKEENNVYTFKEIDILEYISLSHISRGNVREALEWSKKVLDIDPKHPRVLEYAAHFQKKIKREEERKKQHGDTTDRIVDQKNITELHWYTKEKKVYEALCRGEQNVPTQISKQLKCRYLTETHPFLQLAPIKMEYKYLNPDIVMLYDVLSDDEIEQLKELAKPRLRRATVLDPVKSVAMSASYRISKSAWLKDVEAPVVERVSRRAADITGFDLTSAEELQVVNYGIGGYYSPHFDFAKKEEKYFEEQEETSIGNRIATVLFYMSDVAQGGATVFTELGLSLFPVRGAAVVWLNLHASGEGNFATRHASCPVLMGCKWVCSKWIHEVGQEFIKPCDLEYQKREDKKPLPSAKMLS